MPGERDERIKKRLGEQLTIFDQIADNSDIDVVYIVTPTHLHAPLTLRAAAAGKHVWCEKPMAMNAGDYKAEGEYSV